MRDASALPDQSLYFGSLVAMSSTPLLSMSAPPRVSAIISSAVPRRASLAKSLKPQATSSASVSRRSSLTLRIARGSPASVDPSSYSRSPNRPTKTPDSTRIHGLALRRPRWRLRTGEWRLGACHCGRSVHAHVDHPLPAAQGNETCGFFPLNPFFHSARTRGERVSKWPPNSLKRFLAGVVRFAWTFSGRFANPNGELFAEGAESRLQLVEP
jgi:hypothetical protein